MVARKTYAIAKLNAIAQQIEFDKQKALNLILKEGKAKLKEYVQVFWYDSYSPGWYDRTYDFLNCIQGEFVSDDEVRIYYDAGAISSTFGESGKWNIHASFDGSSFAGESFIETVEFGGGGSPDNPRIGYGAHALQRLRAYMLSYAQKAVRQSFP